MIEQSEGLSSLYLTLPFDRKIYEYACQMHIKYTFPTSRNLWIEIWSLLKWKSRQLFCLKAILYHLLFLGSFVVLQISSQKGNQNDI